MSTRCETGKFDWNINGAAGEVPTRREEAGIAAKHFIGIVCNDMIRKRDYNNHKNSLPFLATGEKKEEKA